MNKTEFKEFFQNYSKNVDNADVSNFWKLSDDLILQIIKDNIPVTEDMTLLDAGGGTGRWVKKLSDIYPGNFIIYDLSEDMLEQAYSNIKNAGIENRVEIIQWNLTSMKQISSDSIDCIVSIYSPVSFIYEKHLFFDEIYRVLKKWWKAIIMGHWFYNAIYSKINNYNIDSSELIKLEQDKMVKWDKYVPELNVFSKEIMENDMMMAWFSIEKSYGIPVFIQPWGEDFDPTNQKVSHISQKLENDSFRKNIFDIEMKYNSVDTVVNRWVNIFTLWVKQ